MTQPIIALTTYAADEDGRVNLPAEYIDCVRRAGGRALLVAPGEPDPDGLLDLVDGLVLTGGGDLDPATWGGDGHETVYMVDEQRDSLELRLARLAVERDIPTLAICRGVQVLNVALGGTLHTHLPDVVGEDVAHRLPPREPVPHKVSADQRSAIAGIMGSTEVEPMSWHHQAIDRLGDGLCAVGWAPDGTIEAVELDGGRCVIGVQWHPELTAKDDPSQAKLFTDLIEKAKRASARR